MFFFLAYLTLFFGIFMAGVTGLFPAQEQYIIPDMYRSFFFIMGLIIAMIGMILLNLRAIKVGANHLISPGNPDTVIWFYIYRDKNIKITPSMRVIESQSYNKELDAQINDLCSYTLMDHKIRFVPESIGSSVDVDLCLYAYILKTKWGFSNILQARQGIFKKTEKLTSKEHTISGEQLTNITRQDVEKR